MIRQQPKGMFLRYRPGQRRRSISSPMHSHLGNTPQYRPEVVLEYYDTNKRAVDQFNQLLASYYYNHRHCRWTQAFLNGLFKMAVTNAYYMYTGVSHSTLHY